MQCFLHLSLRFFLRLSSLYSLLPPARTDTHHPPNGSNGSFTIVRYNSLLEIVRQSSHDISQATIGLVVMSPALERVAVSFTCGQVPDMWRGRSYPTLKPLGSYIRDFNQRLTMLIDWYEKGVPTVFWLAGFFFMQSFTTAVKQNYARSAQLAVDELLYDFEAMRPRKTWGQPKVGAFCNGLYLEGATWDGDAMLLEESEPKVLIFEFPVLWIKPTHLDESH